MKKIIAATAAAVLFAASPASAYEIDADGYGFVGKGEVQTAFGWNNASLQQNADALSFGYRDRVEYDVYCMNTVGNGNVLRQDFDRQRNINASVAYEPRRQNQVNGFTLNGYSGGSTGSNNSVACPGGWEPDVNSAAAAGAEPGEHIIEVGSSGGGLTVTHNGVTREL